MAKKQEENLYTIDHANKLADRVRSNPNRRLLRLLRAGESLPEDLADVVRGARRITDEPK